MHKSFGYTPDGLEVVIIDPDEELVRVMVVRPGKDNLLSTPMNEEPDSRQFAWAVVKYGVDIYNDWRGPTDPLKDFTGE